MWPAWIATCVPRGLLGEIGLAFACLVQERRRGFGLDTHACDIDETDPSRCSSQARSPLRRRLGSAIDADAQAPRSADGLDGSTAIDGPTTGSDAGGTVAGDASVSTADGAAAPQRKRGMAYGHHTDTDLAALSAAIGWWYNWSPTPDATLAQAHPGVDFVPMIWGGTFDTNALASQVPAGAKYLLTAFARYARAPGAFFAVHAMRRSALHALATRSGSIHARSAFCAA